ncbi:MAG TPA: transposase [Oscillatoriaceae cyanobacterium M33_DOE_052]|nr:transposase [Oscillatoriaceae cyanobacterium M33_DOE_052]
MILKKAVTGEGIRKLSQKTLSERLGWKVKGYKVDEKMLIEVLIKAAIDGESIEAVSQDLEGVADGNSVREALNRVLRVEALQEQEKQLNEALADCLPEQMPREGLEWVIDFHDEPFYGKSEKLKAYTVRGEAKEGTTYFWRIATLYVIWRQVRITLALRYVLPGENSLSVLEALLERGKALGFSPQVLYLDKGFCSGPIIRYLQRQEIPSLIACPIRGKAGGTRALCKGRKAYRSPYTFSDGTSVELALVPSLKRVQGDKRERTWLAFVLIHLDWPPKQAQKRYRRRFGVESSYRQLGQLRAHSNSRNPALRFFFLALALFLLNLWVFLLCLACRLIQVGPFSIDPKSFRLNRFKAFLRRALEQAYHSSLSIPIYTF